MSILKQGLIFTAGVVLGSAVTYKIVKEMYEETIHQEIQDIKQHYKDKLDKELDDMAGVNETEDEIASVLDTDNADNAEKNYDFDETIQQNVSCDEIRKKKQEFIEHVKKEEEATGRKAYTKDYTRYSMDDDVHRTDDESKPSVLDDEKRFKPDEDDPHIFIIPESSFGTDEYDTMEVYRFADGIFSDEVYEEIDTDVELFGVTAIQMLAFYGKDIVYVRNTRTQIDYCITNDERPFDAARTDYYGRG